MGFRIKFEDKDHGWANWQKGLRFLGGKQSTMEVGLLDGDASPEAIFKGSVNEFGTGKVPPRPWFSTSMAANSEKYLKFLAKRYVEELEKGMPGGDARIKAALGEEIVKDLTTSIVSGDWVPNAASTVRRKGFDWPLVETGELSRSVSYRVVKP